MNTVTPRVLYTYLKSQMHTEATKDEGHWGGMASVSDIERMEFADQLTLTAVNDVAIDTVSEFVEGGGQVVIKAGSTVDNIPQTADEIQFSVDGKDYRITETLTEENQLHHSIEEKSQHMGWVICPGGIRR